jgi:hypothetical protein
MTELTRRPAKGPDRGWVVYFGDVRVGHIGLRAGVPVSEPQWCWTCGFYPGCDPGQQTNGTADTFEKARAEFEEAWNRLRQNKDRSALRVMASEPRLHRMEIPDARQRPEAAHADQE